MAIYDILSSEKIPIYHLGDSIETFDEKKHVWHLSSKNPQNNKLKHFLFYIPAIILKPYGIIIKEGLYPHILVQYLLDTKHITYKNIKYCIPSFDCLKGEDLKEFVEKIWHLLKDKPSHAKNINNVAVGLFNTKYQNKKDEVMISAKPNHTIAYLKWYEQQNNKNLKVEISGADNLDWIRTQHKERKMKDTGVINAYVVASGIVRTLKMLQTKWKDGMTLIGIKTDAIYLKIPENMRKERLLYTWVKKFDFENIHPKFYYNVINELEKEIPDDTLEYITEMGLKYEGEINIPQLTKHETLQDIKEHPYKLEFHKKPPKYDEVKLNKLKENLGKVRDLSYIKSNIKHVSEKHFEKYIQKLNDYLDTYDMTDTKKIKSVTYNARKWLNTLIYGSAGSGKTTLSMEQVEKLLLRIAKLVDKRVLVTGFQRSTPSNWVTRMNKYNKKCEEDEKKDDIIINDDNTNWDAFYGNILDDDIIKRVRSTSIPANDIFAIIIDEFFQMPERCLIDLCKLKQQNPDIIIIPVGDHQQIPGISRPTYNWLHTDVLNFFVKNKIKKNYIFESARFSPEVYHFLQLLEENKPEGILEFINFLKTKNPDGTYKYENNDLTKTKYHICHFRKTKYANGVININNKICPTLRKGDEVICDHKFEVDRVYKNNKPMYKQGKKKKKIKCKVSIIVGENYEILDIKDGKCKLPVNVLGEIQYGWFPIVYENKIKNIKFEVLNPAYASTSFREQGREIEQVYTIHDADKMTKQELIVAISRGKSPDDILFRFSNIERLFRKRGFLCAYKDQKQINIIPSRFDRYNNNDQYKPSKNEYIKKLLYIIKDKDGGRYVGETNYLEVLTLKENLDVRMKQHLDTNKPKDKLSPVLKMNKPKIFPFYGNLIDNYGQPYFIYGKYTDILKIEKMHTQRIMHECINKNKKYYNRAGTEIKPTLNTKKLKEYNIKQNEIEHFINRFQITFNKQQNKYFINDSLLCNKLGLKDRKVGRTNFNDIVELKVDAISEMCCSNIKQVKQLREKILLETQNVKNDIFI